MTHHAHRVGLLGEWTRHYPEAERIARRLRSNPGMFNLRTQRIVDDIRTTFGVCESTAFEAIRIARENLFPVERNSGWRND